MIEGTEGKKVSDEGEGMKKGVHNVMNKEGNRALLG